MKHIKGNLSLNAWVRFLRVNLGCGTKAEINLYQIKAEEGCSNMVANILPTETPLTLGWVKMSNHIFF